MNKIVLAGGTGFLGKYLAYQFKARENEVIVISRSEGDILWKDRGRLVNALEGAGVVINLAGKSVDCRYNESNKKAILQSRVETTRLIGESILACKHPPQLWINSSTATIYRHAEDRPMTEDGGEIGKGFSVDVAKAWEKAFFDFRLPATRQVALRMAIVLGKDGGVMKPLKRLAKLGLGGKQGNGNQMFSWIHIEDVFRIISFAMEHNELQGVLNCSSPNPVTNKVLMFNLRKALGVPIGLPSPEWLLKIGAVLIRTETELILKSRWVLPQRLLKSGFTFSYPTLTSAVEEIAD
ncbi:MAG TPA: TIGR01777 family oxidoreductase [Flavisolibacter sp.]